MATIGVRALLNDTPTAPALVTTPVIPDANSVKSSDAGALSALQQEVAAREQLGATVARLEKELNELKSQLNTGRATVKTDVPPAHVAASSGPSGKPEETADEQTRRDAGINNELVDQVRARFEQVEMDRMYLRDRATREGWMGTVRYSNEVAKLEESRQEIRNNLGEAGYDTYLFATGQPNRVTIREMLQGSPAKQAGLQPGDNLLRYDNQRVYSSRELQNATTAGRRGEMVRVEIERDGKHLDFYVPRGPLGVYLDTDSVSP